MNKPNINIQDILKKLSFLKNNLALLVPIIIAIVAILLFVPTTMLSGRLRSTITDQSVKMSQDIDGLIRDVNQAAEAEAMAPYIEAYSQDANQIDALILQTTERELLSYKLFPDMNETSPLLFEPFRQNFIAGVEGMLKELQAGSPPADAEILAALEASPMRSMFGRRAGSPRMSSGQPGQRLNFRMMSDTDRKIVTKVCEDRARAAKVYLEPIDLGGYAYWSDWKFEDWDKAIRDCWYWQMAYWILDDVTDSVGQINKEADSILDSPVKRVMSVEFTQSRSARRVIGQRRRRAKVPKDKQTPTYVTGVKNAFTGAPCTGRFCNEKMDVMQFDVRVIINAADTLHFMQELCSAKTHKFRGWRGDQPEQTFKHNQITILESSITPVDREDYEHSGYEYGPQEVVDMDLICEYVFNVASYLQIQPKVITEDIENAATSKK